MNAASEPQIEIIRNARARVMRLSVDPRDGRVRLTVPARASLCAAMAWAEEKRGWIAEQRARVAEGVPFAPGAIFPLGGRDVTIVWTADRTRSARREGDSLLCGGPREGLENRVERWLKREALRVLSEETAEFADRAGVRVTQVGVGDPRSRWGSCASSGAIRYSWRLILAPEAVRRATVAHEVAHRIHMNHGPAFHRLVETLLEEDPAPYRNWLRRYGSGLHRFGRQS